MIALAIVVAYILVSAFTARALLRLLMTRPVCVEHREGWFTGKCFSDYHSSGELFGRGVRRTVPLGELTERQPSMALVSLGFGFLWPLTLLLLFVMHARPTSEEMARSNAEMADRIRQLEREIGGTP